MKKIAVLVVASTVTAVLSWGAAAQKDEPIKIGVVVSLSGPAAPYGIPERDSAIVLAEKINGAGGVNGRPIELLFYDDMTNPTEAARAATKLVEQDKVVAIIGASTGSGTLALSPIATRAKVPVLAPNATITVILHESPNYPWVFRTMSNDTVNAQRLFKAAVAGGAKTIGIVFQEDAYGKDAAEYMQGLAQAARLNVVSVVSAPLKAIDLTAQATKLRNEKPDIILLQVNSVGLGAAFARAARQVGLEAPMWSSMGLGQAAFIEAAAGAADGIRMVILGNWDDPSPQQAELGELLKKAGKKPTGFAELLSTNGLLAIVEAAKKIKGPVTGEAIRGQLEQLCPLKTYADGQLCYSKDDHDGWGAETLTSVEVKNGKFVRR
jgi:branched-chain amino acid transport system substrate-binding protein